MRLLDSNVFIEAKNRYYSFEVVPAFWDWLDVQAGDGEIASTDLVYDELRGQGDDLAAWVTDRKTSLFHVDSSSQAVARAVAALGRWMDAVPYASHVQQEFMEGADPFLIAAASASGFTVVTMETHEPHRVNKVKIPNACIALDVPWETTFQMLSRMEARFRLG